MSRAVANAVAEFWLRAKAVSGSGSAAERTREALHVIEAGLLESTLSLVIEHKMG